ncbi:MAG: sugar ABC transporter permease [Acidimicrobiia bacterium]|nr:sugar ABC transporter permease [Acidimicrobiia bacterium]
MAERETPARASRLAETGMAALFLAPSIILFALFFFYPFEQLVLRGLYRNNAQGTNLRYVGWSQYKDVLTGDDFRAGLVHSLQYVLYTVPAGLILGTLLAVAAHRKLRGIRIFQTIFSSTVATSVAVASVLFYVLLNSQTGVLKVDWLNDPNLALFGVSLSSIWQNLGLSFIIVLAGLQTVPTELMEAATLDGYGPVRRFFRITLPLISPVLLFLTVVLVIFALQAFAQIELISRGGPAGHSETLVYKIFQHQTPDQLGVGSVMAVGLFVVTFIVTLAQFLLLDRRVHYGD